MKSFITILIFSQLTLLTFSQEVYYLDLEKSIEIAKEQSFRMRVLNKNLERAGYNLKAANQQFRTKINLELGGPEYTQTIGEWEDSAGLHFFQVNKMYYNTNLTINQPLPTDGSIYISSGLSNTQDYNKDENSMQLGTTINFRQPLQALYSYNRIRSEFKRAQLNYEAAEKRQKREELNLIYDVSQIFYALQNALQRMEIAKQALERQTNVFEIATNKYTAGLIREVEALQIEVDLGQSKNDYEQSIANYESQSNSFKQSLGIPLQDSVVLQGEMEYSVVFVDLNKAIEEGLKNRPEIRESEIDIALTELQLKQQKAQGLISGQISGHYGFSGADKAELPISLSNSFSDSYNKMINSPNDYGIGLSISIPIIDWGENRSRVKMIKADQEVNYMQLEEEKITIEREIRNTVSQLESALRRLQLLEKSVLLAEKSFEISEARFQDGDIDSEALAQDRQRLNNAHISHLEAYISYKLYIADITRKTFYDFVKGQSVY